MPQSEETPLTNRQKKSKKKQNREEQIPLNDFKFRFTIEPNMHMAQVFDLPVTFTDRAVIEGEMNSRQSTARVTGQIPHLWYKRRHIEDSFITARQDSTDIFLSVESNTYNKKQVRTTWSLRSKVHRDNLDLVLNWNNDTQSTFYGELNTSTRFSRTPDENELLINTPHQPLETHLQRHHLADETVRTHHTQQARRGARL